MAVVALVLHTGRPEAVELARSTTGWLHERGHEVMLAKEDAAAAGLEDVHVVPGGQPLRGADLALSLGGDGTMLRTVQMAAPAGVPVLGVNLGQLGYLTCVEPSGVTPAVEAFLAGRFSLDERLVLEVRVGTGGAEGQHLLALNEAVLEKTVPGHTVRLALSLSGEPFITYAADGLIISTPTGSTAYNLSARGPILAPGLQAVLVTPVSPHMLFDRSLVLDPAGRVDVEVLSERPAVLVVDGVEMAQIEPGQRIECAAGPRPVGLVTFGEGPSFHSILKAKFGLSDR
jgi:NAD+ kinase